MAAQHSNDSELILRPFSFTKIRATTIEYPVNLSNVYDSKADPSPSDKRPHDVKSAPSNSAHISNGGLMAAAMNPLHAVLVGAPSTDTDTVMSSIWADGLLLSDYDRMQIVLKAPDILPLPSPTHSAYEEHCNMEIAVFWDIKTQFVLHRRHITSPLQSPAS
jgi:hypothetical protein